MYMYNWLDLQIMVLTSWKNPRVGKVLRTSRWITSTLCSLLRLF